MSQSIDSKRRRFTVSYSLTGQPWFKKSVSVDLKALGPEGKAVTAVDERTSKPLEIKDGTFTVHVKDRNYTFVSLTAK